MINIIICGMLIVVLILGLFFKEILGVLFVLSLILLFSSMFNLCNNIIQTQKEISSLLVDAFLKLTYYFLTALIYCFEYGQIPMIILLVFYLILLILDVGFLRVQYNYKNFDLQKNYHVKVSRMVNLMYSYYKSGDKNALIGTQKENRYILCLAWTAAAYIATFISLAFSTLTGNLIVDLGVIYIKNMLLPTIFLALFTSAQVYLCWKSLSDLPIKPRLKKYVCLISLLGIYISFCSPMISLSSSVRLASIYPFFGAFGIVIIGSLLYVLTLASRYYLSCVNKEENLKV